MSDFLGIELIAGLNETKSVGEINRAIGRLKPDDLKINLNIDEKALQTIRTFNKEMQKLSQTANKTSGNVRKATLMNRPEESIKSIGQVRKATTQLSQAQINNSKAAIKANRELIKSNIELQKSVTTHGKDGSQATKRTYGDRDGTYKAEYDDSGSIAKETNNLEKRAKIEQQVIQKRKDLLHQLSQAEQKNQIDVAKASEFREKAYSEDINSLNKLGKDMTHHIQTMRTNANEEKQIANEQKKVLDDLNKIRQSGYGKESKIAGFEKKAITNDINALQSLGAEVKKYSNEVDLLSKKDGMQKTIKSMQTLHKNGSLRLPKNNMLDDLKTKLNDATTTKQIRKVNDDIGRLQKTLGMRDTGFKDIKKLRADDIIDPKIVSDAREMLRKAQTPEQTQKALDWVGRLKQDNDRAKQSNRELDSIVKQRQDILNKIHQAERMFGTNVNTTNMFKNQVDKADIENLKHLNRNLDDYTKHLKLAGEQETLRQHQQKAQFNVQKLDRATVGSFSPEDEKFLQRYLSSMHELSANTPGWQKKVQSLNAEFSNFRDKVVHADQGVARFSKQMASAMLRVPIYAATISAMYAPMRMFQDALSQTIEIDSQLTVLERVSNGTIEMNQALENSIDIAERLGNVISEVNDGMINFARQGYRGDDLATMTEYATVMSNVSDLDVEESASSLTAAMKGFKIEAEDSLHIVNAMNEVNVNQPPYVEIHM